MSDMQKLKKAEEQATMEVDAARKARVNRLKAAKKKAEEEAASYRQEEMLRLAKLRSEENHFGDKFDQMIKKKELDIQQMKEDVKTNEEAVLKRLVSVVCDVKVN